MARKPVSTYAVGIGPRQRIWDAIRLLDRRSDMPFTEGDILAATMVVDGTIEASAIRDYRRCLVAAGILKQVGKPASRYVEATYRLVKDEGLEAPRVRKDGTRVTQGMAQEQMWRTLRMAKGDINGRELAAHASTKSVPVAESAARDYLKHLNAAGYLAATQAHYGTRTRYRLTRNTGPRPPMVQRTDAVFDPNLGEVVWVRPVNEETAIYGR